MSSKKLDNKINKKGETSSTPPSVQIEKNQQKDIPSDELANIVQIDNQEVVLDSSSIISNGEENKDIDVADDENLDQQKNSNPLEKKQRKGPQQSPLISENQRSLQVEIPTIFRSVSNNNEQIPIENGEIQIGIENKSENPPIKNQQQQACLDKDLRFDDVDYLQGRWWPSLIFFLHVYSMVVKLKKVFSLGIPLKLQHIFKLMPSQEVNVKSEIFYQRLQSELTSSPDRVITPGRMFVNLMGTYKWEILKAFLLGFLEVLLKVCVTLSLYFCTNEIERKQNPNPYLFTGLISGSILLQCLARHWSLTLGLNMSSQFRQMLVNVLYTKVIRLHACSIDTRNLSKIINLVSSDLNSTENKFTFFYMILFSPIIILVGTAFLFFLHGLYGLVCIGLILLVFPIQMFLGKLILPNLRRRMKISDQRIKLIGQSIHGIRQIKMYGWEEVFKTMVDSVRNDELKNSQRAQIITCLEKSISSSWVHIIACTTFILIHFFGNSPLTTSKIFATMEILIYMRTYVVLCFGLGISYIFEFKLFLLRYLSIFMIPETLSIVPDPNINLNSDSPNATVTAAEENQQIKTTHEHEKHVNLSIDQENIEKTSILNESDAIAFKNFSAAWSVPKNQSDSRPEFVLKDLTFSIAKGELFAVIGKVGSGKSSLLSCILEDISHIEGRFEIVDFSQSSIPIPSLPRIQRIQSVDLIFAAEEARTKFKQRIAYVEQEPFVFVSTVRENILFGKPFDKKWYLRVINACCLVEDIKQFDRGDQMEISERGANLSGGQKARICLARAVYSKAEIYLFDDPLSAVDSKVAKKIFSKCMQGILKEKTVVLVTHQIHFSRSCDRVLVLEAGSIKRIGTFSQIQSDLEKLAAGAISFEQLSRQSTIIMDDDAISIIFANPNQQRRQSEIILDQETIIQKDTEDSMTQNVTLVTYVKFLKLISDRVFAFPFITILLFAGAEASFAMFNIYFTKIKGSKNTETSEFLFTALGFSLLYAVLNALKFIFFTYSILQGCKGLHKRMFESMIRARTVFFDCGEQSGKLLSLFSNEMNLLDWNLFFSANECFDIISNFSNLLITITIFNYYLGIFGFIEILLLFLFYKYNKYLILKSKALDLELKSPVYSFFSTTIEAMIPVRIHGQVDAFKLKMQLLCNSGMRSNMAYWLCNRFFGVFVQYIAITSSTVGILLTLLLNSNAENPSEVTKAITFLVLMTDSIQRCLRQIVTVESVMASAGRAFDLIGEESEANLKQSSDNDLIQDQDETPSPRINDVWPKEGHLKFNDVVMKYNKDVEPSLKGLSFEIAHGEKVGCVGRTGAGKSSIIQALFRMSESEVGSLISYDNVDISKLGLHTLRTRISIIPQVPFVFAGTIRKNIDPLSKYTDEQIWDALHLVELDEFIRCRYKEGLLTDMSDVNSVFSMGQRQLICLTRVVLQSNKLLVLDEATANVDMETDNLIQSTIRSKFSNSSVLTIAHRLNTISDYDKIIVLDSGRVAEFDHPFRLLACSVDDTKITKDSIFAEMVRQTGRNNSMSIFAHAKDAFIRKNMSFL